MMDVADQSNKQPKKELQTALTKKDLFWTFIFSNFQQASFNYERIHALAFCVDMIPAIKRLYANKEDQIEALKRHLVFFNVTPATAGIEIGANIAMEEAKANGEAIDGAAINSLKVGLMGPLCGVGDPFFWGTVRPITAAIGAGLALSGNIAGPLFFFLSFNIIRMASLWFGMTYSLQRGLDIVHDLAGNILQKLTEGATIVGLFVMGVLINKWTTINIPLVISNTVTNGHRTITTVQDILNEFCPGLLALGLTLLCMKLLKKKISPIVLIFALFIVGIVGYGLGILGK